MQNARSEPENDVAIRLADASLDARRAEVADEVRRLLEAGRTVMARSGTSARPRVADIVAAAGLSNDAFYRHFASKDQLVAAILEDGTETLRGYLAHQMGKARSPEGEVRRWVEGILAQAGDEEVAATTLAVWWNGGSLGDDAAGDRPSAAAPLAALLAPSLATLGSASPETHATLAAHAVIGVLADHLWARSRPSGAETEAVVAFCLAAGR